MGKPKNKKVKKKRPKRPYGLAASADRHDCYQRSVQSPEADLDFLVERFRERNRREPISLREDFCGTAYLSSVWLAGNPERSALCVDIDSEPLDWGRHHNLAGALGERARLECADVRTVTAPPVDLACAMNFSFCVFKRRDELRDYFRAVHQGLAEDGVFLCELYGGTEAIVPIEERRTVEDFTFVWEQAKFNPITNETLCHIHFEFSDGSRMKRAFTYDWRLWSLPEVRELLESVGFADIDVYWEQVDDEGDGTGDYLRTTEEENQEGWLVLIVASKQGNRELGE